MSALIRKEVRLMFPAWMTALIASILPVCLIRDSSNAWIVSNIGFSLGAMMIGLSSIGQEVSLGTFSTLLAQPCRRKLLWWTKVGLSGLALLTALLALRLAWGIRVQPLPIILQDGSSREIWQVGGLIAFLALSGGFWTTLLFRQVTAAFWITLMAPALICTILLWLPGERSNRAFEMALIVYGIAGFVWAWRQFIHAQDVAWTGGTISLPESSRWAFRSSSKSRRFHPIMAMFRKELQFQQVTFLLAAFVLLMHIAAIVRGKFAADAHDQVAQVMAMGLFMMWSIAIPGMVGCVAVAEERKLGTMEGLLCLPMRRWMIFGVKLCTVLLTATLLGAVVPAFLNLMDAGVGLPDKTEFHFREVFSFVAVVTAVSFYASTLTRNLLQAIGATLILPMLAGGIMNTAASYHALFVPSSPLNGMLMFYITLPLAGLALLRVCYGNFQRLHVGWAVIPANLIQLVAAWIVGAILTLTTYHRAWEGFLSLEPKHGVARLSGPVHPGIWTTSQSQELMVLLPDGRLWMAPLSVQVKNNEPRTVSPKNSGSFCSESNWVSVAATGVEAAGVKADGTLWNIHSKPSPTNPSYDLTVEQMGNDSDWKTVAAGGYHFLALKEDGTLWGWGDNFYGQLGHRPEKVTNGPVRIGMDSDWLSIFPAHSSSFAVKKDGTMWAWGDLPNRRSYDEIRSVPGQKLWQKKDVFIDPVRTNFFGTNWVSLSLYNGHLLALRSDGTLWMDWLQGLQGRWNVLGGEVGHRSDHGNVQVGRESDWLEASPPAVGLKRDGSLLIQDWMQIEPLRPSKYSDWIAVYSFYGAQVIALAADGTVSSWEGPRHHQEEIQLLPTRRPLFSLNIFR